MCYDALYFLEASCSWYKPLENSYQIFWRDVHLASHLLHLLGSHRRLKHGQCGLQKLRVVHQLRHRRVFHHLLHLIWVRGSSPALSSRHHLLSHFNHVWVVHHFFDRWVVHHLLHVSHIWHSSHAHARHAAHIWHLSCCCCLGFLPVTSWWTEAKIFNFWHNWIIFCPCTFFGGWSRSCLLRSWCACVRLLWLLHFLLRFLDEVRILLHHLRCLLHHLRIHHVHHVWELIIGQFSTHLRFVLGSHHGWVAFHHIDHVFHGAIIHACQLLHTCLHLLLIHRLSCCSHRWHLLLWNSSLLGHGLCCCRLSVWAFFLFLLIVNFYSWSHLIFHSFRSSIYFGFFSRWGRFSLFSCNNYFIMLGFDCFIVSANLSVVRLTIFSYLSIFHCYFQLRDTFSFRNSEGSLAHSIARLNILWIVFEHALALVNHRVEFFHRKFSLGKVSAASHFYIFPCFCFSEILVQSYDVDSLKVFDASLIKLGLFEKWVCLQFDSISLVKVFLLGRGQNWCLRNLSLSAHSRHASSACISTHHVRCHFLHVCHLFWWHVFHHRASLSHHVWVHIGHHGVEGARLRCCAL